MLGPLVGGGLMDALPPVLEISCAVNDRKEPIAPENGGPCLSSFPWVSAVWGAAGAVVCAVLAAALLWERCRRPDTKQRTPGNATISLAIESPAASSGGPDAIPLPPRLESGVASGASSYRGGSSGLGRRPVLIVGRSALLSHASGRGLQQQSQSPAVVRSVSPSLLAGVAAGGGGRLGGVGDDGNGEEERPHTR
jgi:hypothetical protein